MEPVPEKLPLFVHRCPKLHDTACSSCILYLFQKECGVERPADEITDSAIRNGKLKRPVNDCDVSESVTPEYP